MGKAYHLISLMVDPLMELALQPDEYKVAILHWVMQELRIEMKDQLTGVEMEVIKVVIREPGGFPEIGMASDTASYELSQRAEAAIERLLNEHPITDLINFISETDTDWKALADKILS